MPRKKIIDPIPDHLKFGYAAEMEKAAIRERLIAEGHDPKDMGFIFKVADAYIEAHKNDLSMREQQEIARSRNWKPRTEASSTFTQAELDYIAYKLEGVNDPDGQSALAKVTTLLSGLENQERPAISEETLRRAAVAGVAVE